MPRPRTPTRACRRSSRSARRPGAVAEHPPALAAVPGFRLVSPRDGRPDSQTKEPSVSISVAPLTPLQFLERSSDVFPDKTAIVYGDRRITYREFAAETTRLAHGLRASGIEPGDRVAYLCPNIAEMLVAHFAVPLAGAVLVAINTRLAPDEVRYICDHSGSKLVVADAELLPTLAPVAGELETVREVVTVGEGAAGSTSYGELLGRGSDEPLEWTVE